MKIAFYKDTFANNRGADIAVKNLAAGLVERGHLVTLFTKPEFDEKVKGDYDVILSAGTNEIQDLANVPNLPPVVQQFHTDVTYPFRHPLKRWLRHLRIKKALKFATRIQVLVSAHMTKLQRLLRGVTVQDISVIGNWSTFEAHSENEQGLASQKVILYPGALNKDKNQALLVKAFAKVAKEFPEWQVHIYGKGKEREVQALKRLIARYNLSDRVLLKGYADLARPYAECAFVAFPSKTEGFPLTIIDAAMFSKPTVMIHDWIGCGVVTTEKEFATSLRKLMTEEDYRTKLGAEAKAYCLSHYSREKILSLWEEALTKALNGTSINTHGNS